MSFIALLIVIALLVAGITWWRSGGQPGSSYRTFKLPPWIRYPLVVLGVAGLVAIPWTSLSYVKKALGVDGYQDQGEQNLEAKIPSASVMNFLGSGEQLDLENINAIVTVYGYQDAVDSKPDSVQQVVLPASDLVGRSNEEPLEFEEDPGAEFSFEINRTRIQGGNLWFGLSSRMKFDRGSSGRGGSFTIHETIPAEALFTRGFGDRWDGSNIGAIPVVAPETSLMACIAFAHKNDPLKSVEVSESLEIYHESDVYRQAFGEGSSLYNWNPSRTHQKGMPSGLGLFNFVNGGAGMLLVICCFLVSLVIPFYRVLSFCAVLFLGILLLSWTDKTAIDSSASVLENAELPAGQRELAAAQLRNTFFWKETAASTLERTVQDKALDESIRDAAFNSITALKKNQ